MRVEIHDQAMREVGHRGLVRQVWFIDGPQPRRVGSDRADQSQLIAVGEDGSGWAVIQVELHPAQLDRPAEFSSMPGALANQAAQVLADHGVTLAEDLRRDTMNRDAPFDLSVSVGDLTYLDVDNSLYLAHRRAYSDTTVIVGLFDGAWLAVLSRQRTARLTRLTRAPQHIGDAVE